MHSGWMNLLVQNLKKRGIYKHTQKNGWFYKLLTFLLLKKRSM